MGLIDRGLKAASASFIPADAGGSILPFPGNSITGWPVDDPSQLNVMVVYAAVRVLSETLAQLPLHVYRNLPGGGKEIARDHPAYRMLHHRANRWMTSFVWRETCQAHVATWGNTFSEIVFDQLQRPAELYPLRPDYMKAERKDLPNGMAKLVYKYKRPGQPEIEFPAERILHIPGLAFDGLTGYSPVALMRNPLGILKSAEAYGKRLWDNDARPSTVISYPGKLERRARENLKQTMASWRGTNNAGKSAILEEGLTIQDIGVPPEDAQYLQTRRFEIEEIARAFRMQLHMIGDLTHGTYSNIEHQSLEFVKYTMLPWLVRWEQALTMKIVDPEDTGEFSVEFVVAGLERGDSVSRAASLNIQRNAGVLTQNEWRAFENRNPVEGGDTFLRPLNMTSDGDLKPKVDLAVRLVAYGFDPQAALVVAGLDPILHLGLISAQVLPPSTGSIDQSGPGAKPPEQPPEGPPQPEVLA